MNTIAVFFILNIKFSSSIPFIQRLKRSSDTEFDLSMANANRIAELQHFQFQQRLDHFHPDERQWNQNYWVTVTYYKKAGPAFLFVNGEYSVGEKDGFGFPEASLLYAKTLNAICFSLEHRFYGRSLPVNGSLNHLSIAQSLADIANFIKGVTEEFHLPKHINWIAFGCSYGGTLAALARLKYPHLIYGAVASSAPLIAKVDYYEYELIVEEALKSYNSKCVESITLGFEEIACLVISPQNINNISQMFHLNEYLLRNITIAKSDIVYIMINIINRAVQNNDAHSIDISLVCSIMIEHNGTKLGAFAEIRRKDLESRDDNDLLTSPLIKNQGPAYSMEDYEKLIWRYQRCSEIGHFSSFTNSTFLSPVKHLLTPIETEVEILCRPFFGPNFSVENLTERINHANSQYGVLDFNAGNTLFIHGSLDPLHKSGYYKKSNDSLYETIFIKGASHCADISSPSDRDVLELKNARIKIFQILKRWLEKNPLHQPRN